MDVLALLASLLLARVAWAGDQGTLFERTHNISQRNWRTMVTRTFKKQTPGQCASSCIKWEKKNNTCNSWSFESGTCQLAKLTFLEDPAPGEGSQQVKFLLFGGSLFFPWPWFDCLQQVMVPVFLREKIPHFCRGGRHCCRFYCICIMIRIYGEI